MNSLQTISLVQPKSDMESEILAGLALEQKSTPAKYLYDAEGSELFSAICELEEYYPTRTEKGILREFSDEISGVVGREAVIIEPGAGTGEKMELLLPQLAAPAAYVPIEIAPEALRVLERRLHRISPSLPIFSVEADFTQDLILPQELQASAQRKVVFFPGSTIGNFEPPSAVNLLRRFKRLAGDGGGLLIGVDLKKDPWILLNAYDDKVGITAEFNLNLLRRLNRELGANFNVSHFYHEALYNEREGRVEMHLVSRLNQLVRVAGESVRFRSGESIHTENSYKYSMAEFQELAWQGGWALKRVWRDRNHMFGVFYLEPNLA